MIEPAPTPLGSAASAQAARDNAARRLERRARLHRQSGATFVESLIVVGLVGLSLLGAFEAFTAVYSGVVQREADALASLTWTGGNTRPELGNLPPPPPPARAEPTGEGSTGPSKKDDEDDGFWGKALDIAIDLSPIGDVKTLFDPNASVFDKVLAGVSLGANFVPGLGPAVKAAAVGAKAVKAADKAAEVVDTAKDAKKAIDEGKDAKKAAEEADEGAEVAGTRKKADEDEPEGGQEPDQQGDNGGRGGSGNDAEAGGSPERRSPVLEGIGPDRWLSKAGLIYGADPKYGNRVRHVLSHGELDPSRPDLSIFAVPRNRILELIDEAWAKRPRQPLPDVDGNDAYLIPMGKVIGTKGETVMKIVIEKGSDNRIITAHPVAF
jgi:hypothetical protein